MPNPRQRGPSVSRTVDACIGSGATALLELMETTAIRSNLWSGCSLISRFRAAWVQEFLWFPSTHVRRFWEPCRVSATKTRSGVARDVCAAFLFVGICCLAQPPRLQCQLQYIFHNLYRKGLSLYGT